MQGGKRQLLINMEDSQSSGLPDGFPFANRNPQPQPESESPSLMDSESTIKIQHTSHATGITQVQVENMKNRYNSSSIKEKGGARGLIEALKDKHTPPWSRPQNGQQDMMSKILQEKADSLSKFIDQEALKRQKQIEIKDIKVYFPHQPYGIQLDYMSKVIESLNRGENALLESPTGTGKTLCLLSSVLSWVYKHKMNNSHKRVIYLSRTHTQLYQVQKQLKNTCFRPTMAIVGSRDHFCVKQELSELKGRQKIQACSKGVKLALKDRAGKIHWSEMDKKQVEQTKAAMCGFYRDKTETVDIAIEKYMNKILDIQSFRAQASDHGFCPYYYPFHTDQLCDLFVMPYNYILDIDLLPRFASMISGSVIIFDEAQNVSEAACEGRSYEMMMNNINGACAEIDKMFSTHVSMELKQLKEENKAFLNESLQFLEGLRKSNLNFIDSFDFTVVPNQAEKVYYSDDSQYIIKVIDIRRTESALIELFGATIPQFSYEALSSNKQLSVKNLMLDKVYEWTSRLGNLIQELKQTEDGIFHNLEKVSTFWTKAAGLVRHHKPDQSFFQNQINHYRLILRVKIDKAEAKGVILSEKIEDYSIELRCLVPWLTFQKILDCSPRSLIFTSGTMSPLDAWQNQLNIKAPVRLVNKHVIKPTQVAMNILNRNINEENINFTYQNIRKSEPGQLYSGLLETIYEITTRIPHGILVICPNFKMLRELKFYVSSYQFKKFAKTKKVIFQQKSNQNYIEDFKRFSGKGAILFCVCRGRASEGIDFPDHHCRAVLFIGVPFPNIKDPILVQKRAHFDRLKREKKFDPMIPVTSWDEWYFNNTLRAVSQGVGRVIRHSKDYGMVFLLDERYESGRFRNSLPSWTAPSTSVWDWFSQREMESIEDFFSRNKMEFPSQYVEADSETKKARNKSKEKPRVSLRDTQVKGQSRITQFFMPKKK